MFNTTGRICAEVQAQIPLNRSLQRCVCIDNNFLSALCQTSRSRHFHILSTGPCESLMLTAEYCYEMKMRVERGVLTCRAISGYIRSSTSDMVNKHSVDSVSVVKVRLYMPVR